MGLGGILKAFLNDGEEADGGTYDRTIKKTA